MEREVKAQLAGEIKEHLAGNPLFTSHLKTFFQTIIDEVNRRYDTSPSWDETCRLQGRKKGINEVMKLLSL